MGQRIVIGIQDIGVSIVNDLSREEILFMSLNKSKTVWAEAKKSRIKPLSSEINTQIEDLYKVHRAQREANPDDKQLLKKTYRSDHYRV